MHSEDEGEWFQPQAEKSGKMEIILTFSSLPLNRKPKFTWLRHHLCAPGLGALVCGEATIAVTVITCSICPSGGYNLCWQRAGACCGGDRTAAQRVEKKQLITHTDTNQFQNEKRSRRRFLHPPWLSPRWPRQCFSVSSSPMQRVAA